MIYHFCFVLPNFEIMYQGCPHISDGKESACNAGDPGSIPGSGRAPGEGNGNPLQYSCLENPMDRRAWQATVHGVARVIYNLATKPPPPIMYQSITFKPFLDGSQLPPLSHYTTTPKSLTLFLISILFKILINTLNYASPILPSSTPSPTSFHFPPSLSLSFFFIVYLTLVLFCLAFFHSKFSPAFFRFFSH